MIQITEAPPQGASPKEQVEWAKRQIEEDGRPQRPTLAAAPDHVPQSGIASERDLLTYQLRSEEFAMPGGNRVWLHEITPEDTLWISRKAALDLRRIDYPDAHERELLAAQRVEIYTLIASARRGPEPAAEHVYRTSAADLIARSLPNAVLHRAVSRIAQLSVEETDLPRVLRGFFDVTETLVRTWCSRLTMDSEQELRQGLAAYGACVSSMKQHGKLSESDVKALERLLKG